MAIAVSQAYKDVQSRRSGKTARIVMQYKRRYFDPVAVQFTYEANWHVLSMRDFVDPGEIVDQLDVAKPNIFKATTVTLRLKNTLNQWQRSVNDPSVFAADAVAVNGYYDDQAIFQILYSFRKTDGTWEDCPQFTGYAADYTPIPKQGHMQVLVSASLLAEKCVATKVNSTVAAEAMANSVVDEPLDPSPGDGATAILKTRTGNVISVSNVKANAVALTLTTDYTVSIPTDGTPAKITLVSPAAQNGKALTWSGVTGTLRTQSQAVASVKTVYANAVAMTQGSDYTVSIPTNAVGPAQITLVDATLWVGKAFTWDGTKGVLNKKVEEAVAMYCDAAGIISASRNIQSVIFPGGLSSSKTLDSQADWTSGGDIAPVGANYSPTIIAGSVVQQWFSVDVAGNWTVRNGSITIGGSPFISVGAGNAFAYAAQTNAYGTWEFKAFRGSSADWEVGFICTSAAGSGPNSNGDGYIFSVSSGGWSVARVSGGLPLLSGADTFGTQKTVRVTRASSGLFTVYISGVSQGSFTDNTITTSSVMYVNNRDSSNGGQTVDAISISLDVIPSAAASAAATYIEYVFNLGSTPTALGTLDHFESLNGGTVVYKTACAPDSTGSPGTFDALQALGAGNQMQSTPRQWLKLRIEPTPATGSFTSPEVQKLVAHYTSSTVTLSQVAPTSGTAWDKIQVLAKECNYETGWDATGIFFFRSRTVSGDAVIDLDPWTNIVDVDDTHPGWDRVYNIGHATQTPYEYFYGKDDSGEAEPTSERRFGSIELPMDFSGELVANDAQIAKAAAQLAYQDNYRPKWRCRAQIKLVPWLELSDPVNLTYVTDPKMLESIAGDPLQVPGFAGPAGVALAIKKKMKIVGMTKKLASCTADLLLEEILS